MERIRKYTYSVRRNEKVVFRITPKDGATPKVTASQNGNPVPNTSRSANPLFEFECDEFPGNSHFARLEFSFLPGDPDEALFEYVLRSGRGDRFDDFPPIKKKNKTRERPFRVLVKSQSAT